MRARRELVLRGVVTPPAIVVVENYRRDQGEVMRVLHLMLTDGPALVGRDHGDAAEIPGTRVGNGRQARHGPLRPIVMQQRWATPKVAYLAGHPALAGRVHEDIQQPS